MWVFEDVSDIVTAEIIIDQTIKEVRMNNLFWRKTWLSYAAGTAAAVLLAGTVWASDTMPETNEAVYEAGQMTEEAETETDGLQTEVRRIRFAEDEEDLFRVLQDIYAKWDYYLVDEDMAFEEAPAMGIMASSSAADTGSSEKTASIPASSDYSETNVRTEGIDEADIVKTDGKYIYILKDGAELIVVRAGRGESEVISRTAVMEDNQEEFWYQDGAKEMFVCGSRVYILAETQTDYSDEVRYYDYNGTSRKTCLYTYDLTDPENPQAEGSFEMEGSYYQARQKDGFLYLFTTWEPSLGATCSESILLPKIGGAYAEVQKVILPEILTDRKYLVMAAVSLEESSVCTDHQIIVSGGEQLYVSTESIYAANVDDWSDKTRSEITKVGYEEGTFRAVAAGTVRGSIHNTFSIDEYEGNLRVLTSYWGSAKTSLMEIFSDIFGFDYYDPDRWVRHNALFILDPQMKCIGRLVDLAENEEIKSARYFGDIAYFVTFERKDPLFCADLSDPQKPVILGKLSIPGFSAYLHPFGEDCLLGVGYDADENTGNITGVKLSLFDTSDPVNVTETAKYVIPGVTSCPAVDEYKAIFADASRKLVGFWCADRYLVFTPDGTDSFDRVLLYDFMEDGLMNASDYSTMRGLYIGNEFYLAGSSFVTAFDMENSFAKDEILRF